MLTLERRGIHRIAEKQLTETFHIKYQLVEHQSITVASYLQTHSYTRTSLMNKSQGIKTVNQKTQGLHKVQIVDGKY